MFCTSQTPGRFSAEAFNKLEIYSTPPSIFLSRYAEIIVTMFFWFVNLADAVRTKFADLDLRIYFLSVSISIYTIALYSSDIDKRFYARRPQLWLSPTTDLKIHLLSIAPFSISYNSMELISLSSTKSLKEIFKGSTYDYT